MSERNRQVLLEIMRKPGNDVCADCRSHDDKSNSVQMTHFVNERAENIVEKGEDAEEIEWASCNLGIFLCPECAGIHRSLGVDISRVKSVRLDNWSDEHVKEMAALGNVIVNQKYEQHLPKYYKRPTKDDAEVIRMQFIRAKYERKEFMYMDKQTPYCSNKKEGKLWKKLKKEKRFMERLFTINSRENKMLYYNKEPTKTNAPRPKNVLPLDDTNVVFVPDKIGNPNGFQVTYLKDGKTRNLFLYTEDSKEAIDWYTAIRSAKLERRKLAFPDREEDELCKDLTQNFLIEGYLLKKGPNREPFKKRWFTLDRRNLMYMDHPLAAVPIKEVFIGYKDEYSLENGGGGNNSYDFILKTPGRDYYLQAESLEEKERWMKILQSVMETQPTPQEKKHIYLIKR